MIDASLDTQLAALRRAVDRAAGELADEAGEPDDGPEAEAQVADTDTDDGAAPRFADEVDA